MYNCRAVVAVVGKRRGLTRFRDDTQRSTRIIVGTRLSGNVITTNGVSVEFSKQIVVAYRVRIVNIGVRRRKRVWAVTSSCLSAFGR